MAPPVRFTNSEIAQALSISRSVNQASKLLGMSQGALRKRCLSHADLVPVHAAAVARGVRFQRRRLPINDDTELRQLRESVARARRGADSILETGTLNRLLEALEASREVLLAQTEELVALHALEQHIRDLGYHDAAGRRRTQDLLKAIDEARK
jgi:hypothetical protein